MLKNTLTHEGNILLHKAAKKAFDDLGVRKPPAAKSLWAEYAALLAVKANIDRFPGTDEREAQKEKEHNLR
jgi:hypothetical protein